MTEVLPAARIAALLPLLTLPALAQSPAIVSPADRATLEGSSSSTYPLGRFDCRVQQLHADLGAGPRTLTGHAYRRDALALHGQVDPFATDLEVTVSNAALTPDVASGTFASNIGTGSVTVLPRTTISFPATQRPPADPASTFDLRIPWSTPFQLAGGATLCLDVKVFGNVTSSGTDHNFTPYLDAHQLYRDGRNVQPGFRFGDGCAANGSGTPHTARLELTTFADGTMSLDVDSRDGVPTAGGVNARTVLLLGLGYQPAPLPIKAGCSVYPTLDVFVDLPGANDAAGDWSGSIPVANAVAPGMRFYAQLASGAPNSDLTLSDGNVLTAPPLAPTTLPAVRIASGSDRNSPTGTVSSTVPVTGFF